MSLHPNAKLNCDGLESSEKEPKSMLNERDEHTMAFIVPNDNTNEKMDTEEYNGQTYSAPSTNQPQQKVINFEEIQARCNDYLNAANEAKREQKSKPKSIQVRNILFHICVRVCECVLVSLTTCNVRAPHTVLFCILNY